VKYPQARRPRTVRSDAPDIERHRHFRYHPNPRENPQFGRAKFATASLSLGLYFSSVSARAADAAPGSCEPSRMASRPSGFDPSRKDYGASRRGHSGKGPAVIEHAGVAITAPVPGTLLTGLVAALGPACRLRRRYAHAPAGPIFR